jgi:hypothetical protein
LLVFCLFIGCTGKKTKQTPWSESASELLQIKWDYEKFLKQRFVVVTVTQFESYGPWECNAVQGSLVFYPEDGRNRLLLALSTSLHSITSHKAQ